MDGECIAVWTAGANQFSSATLLHYFPRLCKFCCRCWSHLQRTRLHLFHGFAILILKMILYPRFERHRERNDTTHRKQISKYDPGPHLSIRNCQLSNKTIPCFWQCMACQKQGVFGRYIPVTLPALSRFKANEQHFSSIGFEVGLTTNSNFDLAVFPCASNWTEPGDCAERASQVFMET